MIANIFTSLSGDTRDALALFFNNAHAYFDVDEPAGLGGNLGEYLPYTSRQKLRDRLQNAATRAQQAIAAETRGDHKEAIRLWGIELGEEFPSYN